MVGGGSPLHPGEIELPSKQFWWALFDALFISAFAVGWTITLIERPEVVHDNPILRAFHQNNICVGVDKGSARLAANIVWGVMLVAASMFLATSYLHMKVFGMDPRLKSANMTLLFAGYLLVMCFGLSFGVEPDIEKPNTVYAHTWGFALGSIGYSMIRLSEVLSFINQYERPWPPGGNLYVSVCVLYLILTMIGSCHLIRTLLLDDLELYLAEEPPTGWEFGAMVILSEIWTACVLLIPMLTFLVVPQEVNKLKVSTLFDYEPVCFEPSEEPPPCQPNAESAGDSCKKGASPMAATPDMSGVSVALESL